jgi:signal transduction histidine kinase/FixJ family two-component response regulator
MKLHPLLTRQLRKIGIVEGTLPTSEEQWNTLLERVSATYTQADQDRYMLERSLERSSEEMGSLYDELRITSSAEIARQREELTKNLALMQGVQESVADAIVVIDATGKVLTYNQRFLEMFEISQQQVANGVDALMHHARSRVSNPVDDLDRYAERYADSDACGSDEFEMLNGRIFNRYTAPVTTPDGKVQGRVWCFRDITEERKLAAHRAVVTERMTSVGQLVASVAHEINNPLAYIAGNVETVIDSLSEPPEQADEHSMSRDELVEALDDARIGVDRIKVIVRDLRALSRVDDETREEIDLRSVIETSLQMANNELRHRARIVRDLQKTPNISANSVRLGQVFLNLLVNAAHAIPDGRASENSVYVSTSTTPDGDARIEIRDTGSGIAPEYLERIYDPFFTTKPVGTGTGLGLSICKGIVDKLGGTIDVDSTVGVGTTFVVELPPATRRSIRSSLSHAPSVHPNKLGGSAAPKSILVVDDDAQIRRWFQRILPRHKVTTVPSVEAAEDAIMTTQFDVILCDVMMPDRTGLDMHRMIEAKRPDLLRRVVFMSGGAFTPALATFLETVPNTCLKKPFRKEELERAIEAALDSGLPPPNQVVKVAQELVQTVSARSLTLT